jgi:hypothetical protein
MSWRYWIKFEGADVDTFSTGHASYTAVELPIFGISPGYTVESSNEVSMSGTEIGQRRIRVSLEVDCIPNSTWDSGTVTTDNIQFLLQTVLQKKYTRIVAPNAGTNNKQLPQRWRDSTNFPLTAGLIPFVFARCDFSNEKQWASGLEKFTITCYRKDLI